MFSKLFNKSPRSSQHDIPQENVIHPRVGVHYGIPSSASILAFDHIQRILAIGTLDGRIKVIGGDNIEVILFSPKSCPFKHLEFLENQGFLVSVSNENEIQVWDLENRRVASSSKWESNITSFTAIYGTQYMYVGDEFGFLSVLKYDNKEGKIIHLPYHLPQNIVEDAAGISSSSCQSIVGVLPQPCSSGNRVLIAFENGLIILWDVTEDRAVIVKGTKDLQLKDDKVIYSPEGVTKEELVDSSVDEQTEKEISSLCWVSSDGSILAVGYVDGDILLWNLSTDSKNQAANNVVKLQTSSAKKRLPVIVLHWSSSRGHTDHDGRLFVYGGDEIGSEEVLTILSLHWSSGVETFKCIHRVDLRLNGSYADMVLVPNVSAKEKTDASSLFVLSSPGHLHYYDDSCIASLVSKSDKKHSIDPLQYPMVVPTVDPCMTVCKMSSELKEGSLSAIHPEGQTVSAAKHKQMHHISQSSQWPITGGVPSQLFSGKNNIKRIFIAGYQDGSVRVWDATYPTLSLILLLGSEVDGIELALANAMVSELALSSHLALAVGNEHGVVRLYSLMGSSDETKQCHYVTGTKHEVHDFDYKDGARVTAIFTLIDSPIRSLFFSSSGERLVVGFECGQVALLDVISSEVIFLTESLSTPSSTIVSLAIGTVPYAPNNSSDHSNAETSVRSQTEVVFVLMSNSQIIALDTTGHAIISLPIHSKASNAVSICLLGDIFAPSDVSSEEHSSVSSQDTDILAKKSLEPEFSALESQSDASTQAKRSEEISLKSYFLLSSEDSLRLYSLKSLMKGENQPVCEVSIGKQCCHTMIFKKDGRPYGLILIYQTGMIEIRTLPDLKSVGNSSMTALLRWNFKNNMNKTITSSDSGMITLVNAGEFALISLLAFENDLRIPEALPALHDKVVEAAADAALNLSQFQTKKQESIQGVLSGLIKGLKREKSNDLKGQETIGAHLEKIFSRFPFSDPSEAYNDDEVIELTLDDIDIEEPPKIIYSAPKEKVEQKAETSDRERLFEGGNDAQPTMRTAEEIKAKYRKAGDASAAANQARDKLLERKEKLEQLSERTAELQSGSENFASMASQLAKQMEKRSKWWNI
ncbi:uncharacterized protein LOC124925354 [Impatiens glandulifera]|uniref:uncharacterized protein LOC124925354 n=1 Tax=Impatiens glandulifera TaxID=253017 RepID=UPI001FB0AA44|nr:uncharacterized protein LOC124925354 [Impatiens glandulifera]